MHRLTLQLFLASTLLCASFFHDQARSQDLPFQDKILPVLFNPKIQSELEISDKQMSRLKELLGEIKKSQQEFGSQLKEFSRSGASKEEVEAKKQEFISQIEKQKKEVQSDALDLLLPHQFDRLKQLTIQVMMRESAKTNKNQSGLLTEEMKAFLEIDDKQAEKIKNKSLELQKKLMAEFKQLQDKYSKELLKELSAKQRKKYEEAVGNHFFR